MTLSERFAKLTQMNTVDKREFAKPVLAANEMDTKLKVVKDLRGPSADTKIYVDGQGQNQRRSSGSTSSSGRRRSRPRSPEFAEGERRYQSDERRRHFEKMSRDSPHERPADWSDMTVRYNYYRDRGCFADRPLTLEEYEKWETWYYEYKNWLETEELYKQQLIARNQQAHPPIQEHEFGNGIHSRIGYGPRQNRRGPGHLGDRTVQPLMSARLEHRVVRSPYFNDRGRGGGAGDRLARRIGHAPSGSLVINVRQDNNNNYGRQMSGGIRGGRRLGPRN
jgi:hypothetical protein